METHEDTSLRQEPGKTFSLAATITSTPSPILPHSHSQPPTEEVPAIHVATTSSLPSGSADNLIDTFPPPLPIPSLNSATSHLMASGFPMPAGGSSAAYASSVGSSQDSLISQLAGVSAIHGQIARSNSRASELGHGKKRSSPEKSFQHSLQNLEQQRDRVLHHQGLGIIANHPRLKVEDALGYLDQVKVIFAHRPKVYNDFLDIMKEFKSQSLDTPGVITRVASLFHGHSDLIVGFNAFLPHGYKIDIDHLGIVKVTIPSNQVLNITDMMPIQYRPEGYVESNSNLNLNLNSLREKSQSPTSTVSAESDEEEGLKMEGGEGAEGVGMEGGVGGGVGGGGVGGRGEEHQLTQMEILCSTAAFPKGAESERGVSARGGASAPTSKGVEFDYAINYVNKIKGRFHDQPQKYKRFLEILHAYQGKIRLSGDKPLDETDVYKEVGRLFGDHPDLMNDFSRFLPNACATMPAGPTTPPATSSIRTTSSPSRSESSSPPPTSSQDRTRPAPKTSFGRQGGSSSSAGGKKSEKTGNVSAGQKTASGASGAGGSGGAGGRGGKNFDKNLEKKSQKNSSGGKKNYSEEGEESGRKAKGSGSGGKKFGRPSGRDFRNGKIPDILPEGPKKVGRLMFVSEKEKERAEPVVAPPLLKQSVKTGSRRGQEGEGSGGVGGVEAVKGSKKSPYRLAVPVQRKKLKRLLPLKKVFKPTRAVSPAVAFSYATFDDFSLMDRIRRAVPVNVFTVLLKTFELYTSHALTKGKLLEIVERLLYHKPKLVQEFSAFLQTKVVARGGGVSGGAGGMGGLGGLGGDSAHSAGRPLNDAEHRRVAAQKAKDPENRMAEIDFKAFEKFTESRSYRIRPANLPKQKSSGSTSMDRQVLNDKYVSCPIFSEGSQFLISKKNIAEEVMFKCEDEKYEMDMLLAGAEAAIHAMTYQLELVGAAGENARMLVWEEAGLHRRIIHKLYTENAAIIMAHLKKNPACAIPTVLERLKQKHIQWVRVQNSMSEIWMDQARRNASKIGDYKGATFKQIDQRFLRSRHLVHEMEKLYSERVSTQQKTEESGRGLLLNTQKTEESGRGLQQGTQATQKTEEGGRALESGRGLVQKTDENNAVFSHFSAENKPHLIVFYPPTALTIDDATFFILRYIRNHAPFSHSDKKEMNVFLTEYLFRCLKIPDTSSHQEFFDSSDDDSDSDEKSSRIQRSSVPRLAVSSSDDDDVMEANKSKQNTKFDASEDETENTDTKNQKTKKKTNPNNSNDNSNNNLINLNNSNNNLINSNNLNNNLINSNNLNNNLINSNNLNNNLINSMNKKEFPIAPLPWPELCQYSSGDLQPLDSQIDESLSEEAKKREKKREKIARRLTQLKNNLSTEEKNTLSKNEKNEKNNFSENEKINFSKNEKNNFLESEKNYVLIFGSSPFFLFVRYHQILCDRLAILHNSYQNTLKVSTGKQETPPYIVSKTCKPRLDVPVERFWSVFTDRLLKLLDGNVDPLVYEEEMREIFRKDAYLSFTLDRLIQSIARQLHHIVAQERAKTVWNYWEEAWLNGGAGGTLAPLGPLRPSAPSAPFAPSASRSERLEAEKAYEAKVSDFLKDQNCFKIVVSEGERGSRGGSEGARVGMELTDSEEPEDQQPLCRNWKDFVNFHADAVKLDDSLKTALLSRSPVFIARQHRQLSRHRKHSAREVDEEDEEEDEEMDVTKGSDQEGGGAEFSLDDKAWLMTVNIRSQIESDDILGRRDDRVPLSSWIVYRRGAIETANETHRRVSQRRTVAFKRYMSEVWMKKALITQEKHKTFLGMMRDELTRYKQGNSVDAPYFVYYVCRSDQADKEESRKPYWEEEPGQEAEPEHTEHNEHNEHTEHHGNSERTEHSEHDEHDEHDERNERDVMMDVEEVVDTAPSDSSDDEREEDDTETEPEQPNRQPDQKESTEDVSMD